MAEVVEASVSVPACGGPRTHERGNRYRSDTPIGRSSRSRHESTLRRPRPDFAHIRRHRAAPLPCLLVLLPCLLSVAPATAILNRMPKENTNNNQRMKIGEPSMLLYGGSGPEHSAVYSDLEAFGVHKKFPWWADVDLWANKNPHNNGNWPPGRVDQTSVVWKNHMYMFGGFQYLERSPQNPYTYQDFNEVYRLSLHDFTWTNMNTTGDIPAGRDGHSAVIGNATGDAFMVVFGGRDNSNYMSNSTYKLDLQTLVWSRPDIAVSVGGMTPGGDGMYALASHTAAVHDNKMFVYGGTINAITPPRVDDDRHSVQSDGLAMLDLATWRWENPVQITGQAQGPVPPAMSKHTAVVHDGHMYMYGGIYYNNSVSDFLVHNEVWGFDMEKRIWTNIPFQITEDEGIPWAGRYNHAAEVYKGEMFISGGRNIIRWDQAALCLDLGVYEATNSNPATHHDHCVHNDVVALNLKSFKWRIAYPGGMNAANTRVARYGHTIVPMKVPGPYGWHYLTSKWTGPYVMAPICLTAILMTYLFLTYLMILKADKVAEFICPYEQVDRGTDDVTLLPPDPMDSLERNGLALAGACLILLSSTSLLQEWSEDKENHYPFRVTSLVFCTEFCKLLLCTPLMINQDLVWLPEQFVKAKGPQEVQSMLNFHRSEFKWYVVPAALYSIYFILTYTVVLDLGAGVSQVVSQLKVLFTGIIYDVMARYKFAGMQVRTLNETEWVGMAVLFLAEAVVAGHEFSFSNSDKVLGIFAAILMGLCGTLANLFLEAILKHTSKHTRGADQSIFVQNIIMYTYTSFICLLAWIIDVCVAGEVKNLFHGWDHKTWALLLFQVGSGQAVAFMFKFLNNITYTVVNTISVAFTGFLGTLFLNDGMSYDFLVACLLVSLSGYIMYKKRLDKGLDSHFHSIDCDDDDNFSATAGTMNSDDEELGRVGTRGGWEASEKPMPPRGDREYEFEHGGDVDEDRADWEGMDDAGTDGEAFPGTAAGGVKSEDAALGRRLQPPIGAAPGQPTAPLAGDGVDRSLVAPLAAAPPLAPPRRAVRFYTKSERSKPTSKASKASKAESKRDPPPTTTTIPSSTASASTTREMKEDAAKKALAEAAAALGITLPQGAAAAAAIASANPAAAPSNPPPPLAPVEALNPLEFKLLERKNNLSKPSAAAPPPPEVDWGQDEGDEEEEEDPFGPDAPAAAAVPEAPWKAEFDNGDEETDEDDPFAPDKPATATTAAAVEVLVGDVQDLLPSLDAPQAGVGEAAAGDDNELEVEEDLAALLPPLAAGEPSAVHDAGL